MAPVGSREANRAGKGGGALTFTALIGGGILTPPELSEGLQPSFGCSLHQIWTSLRFTCAPKMTLICGGGATTVKLGIVFANLDRHPSPDWRCRSSRSCRSK